MNCHDHNCVLCLFHKCKSLCFSMILIVFAFWCCCISFESPQCEAFFLHTSSRALSVGPIHLVATSQNRSEQPEHPMATTRHTAPLPHSSGSPSSHDQFQPPCSSAPFASPSTSPAQCQLLSFEVIPLILKGNYSLLPLLASADLEHHTSASFSDDVSC